jgi:hypothetical protein
MGHQIAWASIKAEFAHGFLYQSTFSLGIPGPYRLRIDTMKHGRTEDSFQVCDKYLTKGLQ